MGLQELIEKPMPHILKQRVSSHVPFQATASVEVLHFLSQGPGKKAERLGRLGAEREVEEPWERYRGNLARS